MTSLWSKNQILARFTVYFRSTLLVINRLNFSGQFLPLITNLPSKVAHQGLFGKTKRIKDDFISER